MSKASGSEDEPLVPDDFDDEFYKELIEKVPEITKALRQKDTQNNADNVQRLLICGTRYKNDLQQEQEHSEELKTEIANLHARLENAARLTKLDHATIEKLRAVIESAWRQKDAAQIREQTAQDEVLSLREKLDAAERIIQSFDEKRTVTAIKHDDYKEHEKLNIEIKELNKRLQIQRIYTAEIEAMTQTLEAKNKELFKLLDETSNDVYNLKRKNDALQKELNALKIVEIRYQEQIAQLKTNNEHLTKMKVRQNLQLLSLKTNLEHLSTQHNANCNKLAKNTVELEYAIQERDKSKHNLNQNITLLKLREDEMIKLKQDNAKLSKSQENMARKYAGLEEMRNASNAENVRLKTQLNTQDKELDSIRHMVHHFEKNNNNLIKERDVLKRDLLNTQRLVEHTSANYQETQHEVRALKDTINCMDIKYKKLQDDVSKLKKEREKKLDEIQNWVNKVDVLQNEIHLKENYEIELKRTNNDLENKCSKFQQQHEILTCERNNLLRNLQAAEEEKNKLCEQISNLQAANEFLRSKVSSRDAELSKLQLQIDRMEKERRLMRNEIRNAQLGQQHMKSELLDKRKENNRYAKSLQEDEQEMARLKRQLDQLMNEKNAVGAALTKRNEEYTQLKDELTNLHTIYNQTEKQYTQCQDDIRILRIEVKNLRAEREVLRKDRESTANLRLEVLQMHRVLNQERIKARALQEEMLTPMNVHRWRNLHGKDPEKMDLIIKLQTLRKHILNQNVAALEQERALIECQQLYAALKQFMLKLPNHKIKEELNTIKASLSAKDRKLKVLKAELNAREAMDKTAATEIDELKSNLAIAKTQLAQEKRRKQKLLEERQLLEQMQAQCFSAPTTLQRTLGAGFKIVSSF